MKTRNVKSGSIFHVRTRGTRGIVEGTSDHWIAWFLGVLFFLAREKQTADAHQRSRNRIQTRPRFIFSRFVFLLYSRHARQLRVPFVARASAVYWHRHDRVSLGKSIWISPPIPISFPSFPPQATVRNVSNIDVFCATFSQFSSTFKCNRDETNDTFVASRSFLSSDYRTDEFRRERERRIVVYGSVARYGPRVPAQGVRLERTEYLSCHLLFFRRIQSCLIFTLHLRSLHVAWLPL